MRYNCLKISVLFFTLMVITFGFFTYANADEPTTLRFGWGYDPAAEAIIDGFRLYENSQPMSIAIPSNARTVDTPYIKDRQARRYHLTAFDGAEESAPSAYVDIAAHWTGVPAILGGSMNVQLLDKDGNVIQEINSSVQGTINQ